MTEGHPCFVANNGRLGFGIHEYHAYAPETASPRPAHLARRPPRPRHLHRRRRPRLRHPDPRRTRPTRPAPASPPPSPPSASTPPTTTSSPPTPGSGGTSSPSPSPPKSPSSAWSASAPATTTTWPSSRSAPSSTPPAPTSTTSKRRSPSSTWASCAACPPSYMEATPAINDWLARLIAADDTFQAARFSIIRERAALGYHHRQYEAATTKDSPYRKMLAALWRESPVPALEPGQRLATMASLLHVDRRRRLLRRRPHRGVRPGPRRLAAPLPRRLSHPACCTPSTPTTWSSCRTARTPSWSSRTAPWPARDLQGHRRGDRRHGPRRGPAPRRRTHPRRRPRGQEAALRLHRRLRLLLPLPQRHPRRPRHPRRGHLLAHGRRLRHRLPGRPPRTSPTSSRQYDLFADEFALSCLNRLQLRNNQQMVDLQDPAGALQLVGTLRNPLAPYAPAS